MEKQVYNQNTVIYTFESKEEITKGFSSMDNIINDALETLGSNNHYRKGVIYVNDSNENNIQYILSFGPHDVDCIQIISLYQELEKIIRKMKLYFEKAGTKNLAERLKSTNEFLNLVYDNIDIDKCFALMEASNIFMSGLSLYLDNSKVFNTFNKEDQDVIMKYLDNGLIDYDNDEDEKLNSESNCSVLTSYFTGRMGDILSFSNNTGIHGELYKKNNEYVIKVKASPSENNICMEWLEPWNENINNLEHIGKI